jgi:hypothetical protein
MALLVFSVIFDGVFVEHAKDHFMDIKFEA